MVRSGLETLSFWRATETGQFLILVNPFPVMSELEELGFSVAPGKAGPDEFEFEFRFDLVVLTKTITQSLSQ